jgi:hypothetical protein
MNVIELVSLSLEQKAQEGHEVDEDIGDQADHTGPDETEPE